MQDEQQTSRSVRVKLTPAMAELLLGNVAQISRLQAVIQTLTAADQATVAAIAKDAGHDLNAFQSWQYDTKNGATELVLIPAPLPMPPQPTPSQE